MNWDAIGAIGEILGATVVILTLAYLTSQIRQNTKALFLSTLNDTQQMNAEFRSLLLREDDVWYKGTRDPDSLTEQELHKFTFLVEGALFTMRHYFFLDQNELDTGSWQRQKKDLPITL